MAAGQVGSNLKLALSKWADDFLRNPTTMTHIEVNRHKFRMKFTHECKLMDISLEGFHIGEAEIKQIDAEKKYIKENVENYIVKARKKQHQFTVESQQLQLNWLSQKSDVQVKRSISAPEPIASPRTANTETLTEIATTLFRSDFKEWGEMVKAKVRTQSEPILPDWLSDTSSPMNIPKQSDTEVQSDVVECPPNDSIRLEARKKLHDVQEQFSGVDTLELSPLMIEEADDKTLTEEDEESFITGSVEHARQTPPSYLVQYQNATDDKSGQLAGVIPAKTKAKEGEDALKEEGDEQKPDSVQAKPEDVTGTDIDIDEEELLDGVF
ncbi:hypothetical protein [Parashewanella tropica]|uniref:hypothetical protein n=1 Tax=Parashewanella tropica TaxID=2547970 RepID=UPI001059B5F3|nr:hypothetical protein [Parashewanella tropica]